MHLDPGCTIFYQAGRLAVQSSIDEEERSKQNQVILVIQLENSIIISPLASTAINQVKQDVTTISHRGYTQSPILYSPHLPVAL